MEDKWLDLNNRMIRIEEGIKNIQASISDIDIEKKSQDIAIDHTDTLLTEVYNKLNNFTNDFDLFKTEIKESIKNLAASDGMITAKINELEYRVRRVEDDTCSKIGDFKKFQEKHQLEHAEEIKLQRTRNWQLWIIVATSIIGFVVTIVMKTIGGQ